jgi:flagellin-like protein
MRLRRPASQPKKRQGVSEVIAALMLIVIVVSVAGIVVFFGMGVINTLLAGGLHTPITGSGQMSVPGSVGTNGVLTLSLRNSEAQTITGLTVICPSEFTTSSCMGLNPFQYKGVVVSPAAPLPPGATATASTAVAGQFTAGTTYSILVTASFGGGSIETIDLSVAAVS